MTKYFFSLLFSITALAFNAANTAISAPQDDPTLTVTQMSPTTAQMSWTEFGSPGQYTVKVTDITDNRVVTQFNTNSFSATIGNLSGGHYIEFKVIKAVEGNPPMEILIGAYW